MFGRHTWVYRLLGCWMMLFSIFPATAGDKNVVEEDAQALACRLVCQFGEASGGAETIGSLIELNMRQWKPQSSRGIEIYGWQAQKVEAAIYRVTYEYEEIGCDRRVLSWQIDLRDANIVPLTPLSRRIMEMSQNL